ncbi:kinase-like protein [Cryphonectria parasitica EP155]|uniref:Kinase-like protein n=1 Tax=Cryphonectria parasitica (strain ATCC 38755 / EP155) TaxID=660469 RepID=A0A9P4YCD4_CRYP1|nr:kinase-like protein [Cryphonectria parasitica EP155]KAF3770758.1 kinase-like protein [Cryphonectria parasitica EP155]
MTRQRYPPRLTYPYYAPAETLPAPLPTVPEILASEEVFPCIFQKRTIRKVGDHFIVKHGDIKLDEADNMHLVAWSCGDRVLVPKLYAAFHDEDTGANFIVMEYVHGKSMESLWTELGPVGRHRVATKLRKQFQSLRDMPAEGYYGRHGRRPYDDIFLGSDTLPCGPFPSEFLLNQAFFRRYVFLHPEVAEGRGTFYRDRVFPMVMTGHKPVFTHGDLQAKNILVRDSDGAPVLIDWECAAWYPEYWEYTNALWTSRRWGDDWFRFVGLCLKEYVVEFKCMENLLDDLLDAPRPGDPGTS